MDLRLLVTLSFCGWTVAARSYWTDKPSIIVSSSEISDGQTVTVSCTLPIDYTGGDCRLYRKNSQTPFKSKTTRDFICVFQLTSQELLGNHPVGTRVLLRCDYHLQQYTSVSSDLRGITVWGSRPSPHLSVSRHFVSPDDRVEVTCTPPTTHVVSRCHFYRDEVFVASGSCSRNLTGRQLAIWERSAVLLPVNMSCRYDPVRHLNIRSEPSNHNLLFVVDTTQVSSSVTCSVSVDDDELEAFRGTGSTFTGADGQTVSVHVTNSSAAPSEACSCIQSPDLIQTCQQAPP